MSIDDLPLPIVHSGFTFILPYKPKPVAVPDEEADEPIIVTVPDER